MKNLAKNFGELLESKATQKKINNIQEKTSKNIARDFGVSKEDVNYLRNLINKNKWFNQGMPKGEIEFKGHIIPIDLIFDKVSGLKNAYTDALEINDKKERNRKLRLANNKLISTIFTLLDEEEKKIKKDKEAKERRIAKDKKEKAEHSLEHKLLDQMKHPGRGIELTDKDEIIARINTIGIGDRITFKDGYSITITDKKFGKVKVRFDGTPSLSAEGHKGEGWWNLNDLLKIDDSGIDDIRQLNIPFNSGKKPKKPDYSERVEETEILPPDDGNDNGNDDGNDNGNDDGNDDGNNNPKPPKKTKKPYIPPKVTIKDDPDTPTVFEENAVLSDVSESYEDMISRMVENEINEEWHNTSKFNVFKRGKLFLMRGRMRKKKIAEMKKNYQKTPFTNNGLINAEMSTQAARHDLEEILGGKGVNREAFGEIKRETLISEAEIKAEGRRGKPFKEMCQEYVAGTISQAEFQNRFNALVKKLGAAINQNFLATNVLEKLDAIKNDNLLLGSITDELTQYLSDHNDSHFDGIRSLIDADFKKYRRDPRFRKEIMDILGNTAGLTKEQLDEKIEKFMRHQKALAKMSTQNLQIKLDLLTNGKGAYQTNNKDRENWLFRFGNKLDKMPRWGQALTVAGISASGMLVGGAFAAAGASAFAAGLAGTATLSGLVGAKNFIKKWTHHTKEQNTYEKNLTRNYEEEIAKMKERERIRDEKDDEGKYTHNRFTRYRAKRQLELYGKTTQEHLQNENEGNTKEISAVIYGLLDRYDTLSPEEKNALHCTLLDAKARLETYWAKGHNFLKSKDANQIERDFYELENALNLAAGRVLNDPRATLKDISLIMAYDEDKKAVNYNDLLDLYKKDYNSASKKFRGERAWLATKWGLGTAAITFGTAAATQAIAGTGMFAKDAVPGTEGFIDTRNTSQVSDNFGMGKYELTGGNKVFQAAQDNISGLSSSDTVTLHLGAGTDGTAVRAGSSLLDHSTYLSKLDQVKEVIANSSLSNKSELISQIDNGFATSGFTNTDLHGMRCLELVEEAVKGSGNFAGKLNISYDSIMDIDGSIVHDAASRVGNTFIEISKFVPGTAGTEAGKQWLVIGLPWFSNTFKRNNDGKTEQKTVSPVIDEPKDKPNDNGNDKPKDKGRDNGDNKPTDKPSNKPTDNPDKKATDKGKDKWADNGKDKPTNKGHSSTIIVPPVKSDERDETNEETNENRDEKEEVVTEELKKDVENALYSTEYKTLLDEDRWKTILKNHERLLDIEEAKEKWDKRFKNSPRASARLEEAKDFRKRFPKINFYDENVVKSLKEEFKDNNYVLAHINNERNSGLSPEFKHHLERSEIDKYRDKAKSLVNSSISEGSYAEYHDCPTIIIKLSNDLTIPFYVSSGSGDKLGVPVDRFYPIFGYSSGGWLNKGIESDICNYYGSPLLAAIAEELNKLKKDNKIDVYNWGKNNSSEFIYLANLGKKPVENGPGAYNNINETLKKISKIKETE